MTVNLYKSTDVGAPILTGQVGSLLALLDLCLVVGYGNTRATATITSSGVNVSNNDTVTVDTVTYTFKTALTPAANEVLIGASAAASLTNLAAAMMGYGTSGTTYGASTVQQSNVQVTAITSTAITLQANYGGTGANSIALAKSAATLTVSGATFSGGTGGVTKAAAGWAKPYTATNKAVFRAAAGSRMYLDLDDSGPGVGLGKEARVRGYEAMTAVATGTSPFPTVAQGSAGVIVRKSSALSETARVWKLYANDRSFHLFIATNDSAGNYQSHFFGDIYSYLTADLYKSLIYGRPSSAENLSTDSSLIGSGSFLNHTAVMHSPLASHYMARGHTSLGASVNVGKFGTRAFLQDSSNVAVAPYGAWAYPNGPDGGLYIAPVRIIDPTTSPVKSVRGEVPGLFHVAHAPGVVVDGDTFSGAAGTSYASRTFEIVKTVGGAAGYWAIETTDWAVSV